MELVRPPRTLGQTEVQPLGRSWVDEDISTYSAGSVVPAGTCQPVDTPWLRAIVLTRPDLLPGSFDGKVAVYRRIAVTARNQPRRASFRRNKMPGATA
jgi:hypothetical protein